MSRGTPHVMDGNDLNVDPPTLQGILDRLDQESVSGARAERRSAPRLPYRTPAGLAISSGQGIERTGQVMTRNISRTGLAFLHNALLEAKVRCWLSMVVPGGRSVTVAARVVRNRPLENGLHEIGVEFETQIDLPNG